MNFIIHPLFKGLIAFWLMMPNPGPMAAKSDVLRTLRSIMMKQQDAWNRGDYESFFAVYADDATYVTGGRTIRGRAAILHRFRKRYGTKETMGKLTFSDLIVLDACCPDSRCQSIWVGGKWQLTMDDGSIRTGRFTLGWRWDGKRWAIFYDHSS